MLYVSFCVLLVNLLSWQFDYLSNTVTSTHNTVHSLIEVAVYWSSNLTVKVDVRIVVGVSARVVL